MGGVHYPSAAVVLRRTHVATRQPLRLLVHGMARRGQVGQVLRSRRQRLQVHHDWSEIHLEHSGRRCRRIQRAPVRPADCRHCHVLYRLRLRRCRRRHTMQLPAMPVEDRDVGPSQRATQARAEIVGESEDGSASAPRGYGGRAASPNTVAGQGRTAVSASNRAVTQVQFAPEPGPPPEPGRRAARRRGTAGRTRGGGNRVLGKGPARPRRHPLRLAGPPHHRSPSRTAPARLRQADAPPHTSPTLARNTLFSSSNSAILARNGASTRASSASE